MERINFWDVALKADCIENIDAHALVIKTNNPRSNSIAYTKAHDDQTWARTPCPLHAASNIMHVISVHGVGENKSKRRRKIAEP